MDNLRIPFIHTYRAGFFALFVAGFAFCSVGGISQAPTYGWAHPISITGYVLGIAALLLGATVLLQISVPGISSVQSAILVLGALMVVKGVLAIFYRQPAA